MPIGSRHIDQQSTFGTGADFALYTDEILNSSILIINEERDGHSPLFNILSDEGYTHLIMARNGRDAVNEIVGIGPDMIILDMVRSDSDALDFCRKIRQIELFENTPFIIQSRNEFPKDRSALFKAGVTVIFPDPVTAGEVTCRVRQYLKNSRVLQGLTHYHKRLSRDLEIARDMQKALMPIPELLEKIQTSYQLDIAHQYEASDELGGDFWGVNILDKDRLFIYITDFAGHGVPAALNTFRLHSLVSHCTKISCNALITPDRYLSNMNNILYDLLPVEQFATMMCGIVDVKRGVFSYASAGSTPPMKMTIGTENIECLDPSGLPLGMMGGASYDLREVPFGKGETLFLYSDVLTESEDQMGRMIGDEQFLEMCRDSSLNLAGNQAFLDRILKIFDMHVVRPLKDDLTAVTITRR